MPRLTQKGTRNRKSKSPAASNVTVINAPKDLASLVRGLYGRVASQLNLDPSYVSRVARSERQSEIVENAIRLELRKIINAIGKRLNGRKKRKRQRQSRFKRTASDFVRNVAQLLSILRYHLYYIDKTIK
jgi:hypothetical protein